MTDASSPSAEAGRRDPDVDSERVFVAGDGVAGFVEIVRDDPRLDAADAVGVARVASTAVWRVVNAVTRR